MFRIGWAYGRPGGRRFTWDPSESRFCDAGAGAPPRPRPARPSQRPCADRRAPPYGRAAAVPSARLLSGPAAGLVHAPSPSGSSNRPILQCVGCSVAEILQ